jgi:hypothetical protein
MRNDKYLRAISILVIASQLLKEDPSESGDSPLKRVIWLYLSFLNRFEDSLNGVLS